MNPKFTNVRKQSLEAIAEMHEAISREGVTHLNNSKIDDVFKKELIKKGRLNSLKEFKLGKRSSTASDNSINIILNVLYKQNYAEKGHSYRVGKLAIAIGEQLSLSDKDLEALHTASLLHDIGKIAINSEILNTPGALNDEQWERMRKHPEIGARILSASNKYRKYATLILSHHERWDGGGYPGAVSGEAIPYLARIIAIADAYDAMTSDRPYRNALTQSEAISEIEKGSGTQFDLNLVSAFLRTQVKRSNKQAVRLSLQ